MGEPAAVRLKEDRLAYSSVMRHAVVFRRDEVASVANRLQHKSPRCTVIVIQLADTVSQIVTGSDSIEPFRAWQDTLALLASIFAPTGSICDAGDHRALLFLHGCGTEDLDLIIHQTGATLARFLPEIADVPVLRYEARRFPSGEESLADLAQSLT